MLEASDLDKVLKAKELLQVSARVDLSERIRLFSGFADVHNLPRSVSVELFRVVKVKAVTKELLALTFVKLTIAVLVVLLVDLLEVLLAVVTAAVSLFVQTVLILIEDIGEEQVSQEVKAH